jgi:hypothetical protein
MKAKAAKKPKHKKLMTQNNKPDIAAKLEVRNEEGCVESKALSRQEIENLKDQLEDLNRDNTTGG